MPFVFWVLSTAYIDMKKQLIVLINIRKLLIYKSDHNLGKTEIEKLNIQLF